MFGISPSVVHDKLNSKRTGTSGNNLWSSSKSYFFLFFPHGDEIYLSWKRKSRNLSIVIVTDGWGSIHSPFQSVPLDCFPEQNENPDIKAE